MNEEIRTLFARAAVHRAESRWEEVERLFLMTVKDGVPEGVHVVYLHVEEEPPEVVEEADEGDRLVLQFEEVESQEINVPDLLRMDFELAASLFESAEFCPAFNDWDGEDVADWGCDDPWGDLDDDWEDDDN